MSRKVAPPPPPRPVIVLALDAAWKGTGWAIADARGPLEMGLAKPQGTWKWSRARRMFADLRVAAEEYAALADADLRLVVERTPEHYSFQGRAERGGAGKGADPTLTVRGGSELVGGMAIGGIWEGWDYPWLIEPNDWRYWYDLRGRRENLKAAAIRLAGQLYPWARDCLVMADQEEAGNVAEAMLLASGAVKRIAEAPVGPSRPSTDVAKTWRTRP